jgi:hypothetical protein
LIIGIHFAYGQKHSNGVGITTLQNWSSGHLLKHLGISLVQAFRQGKIPLDAAIVDVSGLSRANIGAKELKSIVQCLKVFKLRKIIVLSSYYDILSRRKST